MRYNEAMTQMCKAFVAGKQATGKVVTRLSVVCLFCVKPLVS